MNNLNRYVAIWLALIVFSILVIAVKYLSNPPVFISGLVETLDLGDSHHATAIELSKNHQRKLLILIGGMESDKLRVVQNQIKQELESQTWAKTVSTSPVSIDGLKKLISYYSEEQFAYLSDQSIQALSQRDKESIAKHYFTLLNEWVDPVVSQSIESDQSLILASFLKQRLKNQGSWEAGVNGPFIRAEDKVFLPLFVELEASALSITSAISVREYLQAVKEKYHQEVEILMTGLVLHMAASAARAKFEVSSFGLFSLVAVVLVVVLSFGSVKPIFACLLVMASAFALGFAVLVLVFETVHLLSFVFAVSIFGIAVDYGFHVLVLKQTSQKPPSAIQKAVMLPMGIALVTTLLGYSLFLSTQIIFLHQVVCLIGFGLIGAYICAVYVLPFIVIKPSNDGLSFKPERKLIYLGLSGAVLIALLGVINFDDDISQLNSTDKDVLAQDQRVAQLSGSNMYPSAILVVEDSKESLFEKSRVLVSELRKHSNNPSEILSVSDWILSEEAKKNNVALVAAALNDGAFDLIKEYMNDQPVPEHREARKSLSSDTELVRENFGLDIIHKNDRYYTLIQSSNKLTDEQLAIVQNYDSAQYIDLAGTLTQELAKIRGDILGLVIPAIIVFSILLCAKFGIKSGLTMVLLLLVSSGLGLAGSLLFQASLNIFNLLACLLIITLIIDYAVFFRVHGYRNYVSKTISLSALTSFLTFGVMTFSQTPAVKSFGLTLTVGIAVGWTLCHLTPLGLGQESDGKHK